MQPDGSILQICHVVEDMDAALRHWTERLGAGPFFTFDVPVLPGQLYYGKPTQVEMKVAMGFSGGLQIELVQQTNQGQSPFRDFIADHGPGLHHIMPRLDFRQHEQDLRANYEVAFSGYTPTGDEFLLFDARPTHGHYIELVDISPMMWGGVELMWQAHRDWDGKTDPVRTMDRLGEGRS